MQGMDGQRLMEALAATKSAIVKEWLARTLESYPKHSCRFLSQEKDPFRNPVGVTLAEAFGALFDQLIEGPEATTLSRLLEPIVRIRAVQDFSPSQAVAFLFLLKRVMRGTLGDELRCDPHGEGLAMVEARIDDMALLAFDLFMKCREQICQIKANEAKRRTFVWERLHRGRPDAG